MKNPNRDFSVVAKEFTIPTTIFQVDSLVTSYGFTVSPASGYVTDGAPRFMCGSVDDPNFGKTTALGYAAYHATNYPTTAASAVFQKLSLTLIFDYYWSGAKTTSEQEFQVYELTDSMLTYLPHYANQSTPYGRLLGEGTHLVSPSDFDQNIIDNGDLDDTNNILDSLKITLDPSLGKALLAAAMDTLGDNERNYTYFSRFRQRFKGLAIVSPNSDKIVGFDPTHAKTRLVLDYKIDTTTYQLYYTIDLPQQASGTPEYTTYTEFRSDRSGTPLAGLPGKYQNWEPSNGMRYIQGGTGLAARLDFSEVFEHFKDVSVKALSVAELRIETTEQNQPPLRFTLRAIRPDNRNLSSATQYTDAANDPYASIDPNFVGIHMMYKHNDVWDKPFFRVDALGDDGGLFFLGQVSNSGTSVYTGYLTNFLQTELANNETDFMRYYALVPQVPDFAKGVNGFYFPADKIKLKIYYTTPSVKE